LVSIAKQPAPAGLQAAALRGALLLQQRLEAQGVQLQVVGMLGQQEHPRIVLVPRAFVPPLRGRVGGGEVLLLEGPGKGEMVLQKPGMIEVTIREKRQLLPKKEIGPFGATQVV